MNQTTKKKKHSIHRELTIGIPILALLSPLIGITIIWSLIGVASGIIMLLYSDVVPSNISLVIAITYGIFLILFIWLLRCVFQRLTILLKQKYHLKAEEQRVAHLINDTSAKARLKEHDLSQLQEKSPTQNVIRDTGLTL